MYSEDSGASWATVAQDIHPRYYSTYSMYDFTWLVCILCISMCNNIHYFIPGVHQV